MPDWTPPARRPLVLTPARVEAMQAALVAHDDPRHRNAARRQLATLMGRYPSPGTAAEARAEVARWEAARQQLGHTTGGDTP